MSKILTREKGSFILDEWDDTMINRARLVAWNREIYEGEWDMVDGVMYVRGHIPDNSPQEIKDSETNNN